MSSLEKKVAGLIGLFLLSQSNDIKAQIFKPPVDDPFGLKHDTLYNSFDVDFIDIDNDGDLDMFSFGTKFDKNNIYENEYIFYENVGSANVPSYNDGSANPFGFLISDIGLFNSGEFADIDGDGDQDLLNIFLTDYVGALVVYKNVGDVNSPNFQVNDTILFQTGLENFGIIDFEMVDIDNDNDSDIFIPLIMGNDSTDIYEELILYIENRSTPDSIILADGIVNPFDIEIIEHEAPSSINFIEFADFDLDGDLDIYLTTALYTEGEYDLYLEYVLYKNNGTKENPSFSESIQSPFSFDSNSSDIIIPSLVDLDQDGDVDLFSTTYSYDLETYKYQFYENDGTSAIVEFQDAFKFKLFPNPTSEILNINIPEKYIGENASIRIYDALGKLYHSETIDHVDSNYQTRVSSWIPGMYNIYLEINGKAISKSFLKE